ncbi:VOC family protein [Kribbella sp. NPDC050124]|uniref:VOC family protein n=1 Tax=Kribbella sp. NPDC050124 TaxID=3364114 RepID=UPI0037A63ADA
MTNPVIHFEIGGRDLGRMTSFYGQLFGWRLRPAGPDYTLVAADDSGPGIGGGLMQTRGEMTAYVSVYVAVDDLKAMLDRAAELGAKTVVEPTEIPGVGAFAMFADPDGNVVGLMHQLDMAEPKGAGDEASADRR